MEETVDARAKRRRLDDLVGEHTRSLSTAKGGITEAQKREILDRTKDVHVSNMVFVVRVGPSRVSFDDSSSLLVCPGFNLELFLQISRKHLRTVIQGSQEGAFPARFCVRLLFATLLVFKDKLVVIGVVNVWRAIMFVHRFLLLASSLQKEYGLPHDLNPINLVLTNMHAVIDFGVPISLDVADTRIVGASYNAKKINMMYAYIEINRRNSDLYKLHVATHHRSRHRRNTGDKSGGDPSLPSQVKTGTCNFAGSGCIVVMGIESLVQLQEIIDHLVELLGPIFVESKAKSISRVQ